MVSYVKYTVSQKNNTDVAHYNFNVDQPILIIFGRLVAERVCYQTVICYPTSPNLCLCTTSGKYEPRKLSFQSCCITCLENKMARREIIFAHCN